MEIKMENKETCCAKEYLETYKSALKVLDKKYKGDKFNSEYKTQKRIFNAEIDACKTAISNCKKLKDCKACRWLIGDV